MTTPGGVSVAFIGYGGIITDIITPDRNGRGTGILFGFPTLRDYETTGADGELYFGALIGRYANWVAAGRFSLDGCAYQISLSDPPNTIHGGRRGFDKRVWTVRPTATSGARVGATLTYSSPDCEEGFPGTLQVSVTYTLSDDGAFAIHTQATTDRDTVVNLTSHPNFNLAGVGSRGGVLRQRLTVDADRFTPVDHAQIPLRPLAPMAGTPFDFRAPTAIGAHMGDSDAQLAIARGYDQNWVLNKHGDPAQPQLAVRAYDPASGRTLDCLTTQPGVQIYTGGFMPSCYGPAPFFMIETQHFPDSPNHPGFPSTELRPGEVFSSTTIFRFGVRRLRWAPSAGALRRGTNHADRHRISGPGQDGGGHGGAAAGAGDPAARA